MMVNHKPYMAFDVEKKNEECVCGKKISFQDHGYCEECLDKKMEYINNLLGEIVYNNELEELLLEPFETFRKRVMSDRISYLIDTYVIENGAVPYTDTEFYVRCLHDKTDLLADMVKDLEEYVQDEQINKGLVGTKRRFIVSTYKTYFNKLSNMYLSDWDTIKGLNSYLEQTPQGRVNRLVLETQQKKG